MPRGDLSNLALPTRNERQTSCWDPAASLRAPVAVAYILRKPDDKLTEVLKGCELTGCEEGASLMYTKVFLDFPMMRLIL